MQTSPQARYLRGDTTTPRSNSNCERARSNSNCDHSFFPLIRRWKSYLNSKRKRNVLSLRTFCPYCECNRGNMLLYVFLMFC